MTTLRLAQLSLDAAWIFTTINAVNTATAFVEYAKTLIEEAFPR